MSPSNASDGLTRVDAQRNPRQSKFPLFKDGEEKHMTRKSKLAYAALLAAPVLGLAVSGAQAQEVSLTLGTSSQEFTQIGIQNGGYESLGLYGYWNLVQGACSGTTATTCTLSGSFTSSITGLTSGTYTWVTQYAGSTLGANVPQGVSETVPGGTGTDSGRFNYIFLGASDQQTLTLVTSGGTYVIPFVTNGQFDANTTFDFNPSGALTCTGLPAGTGCGALNAGLVAGASVAALVTMNVSFDDPVKTVTPPPPPPPPPAGVPEPTTLALLGLGLAAVGFRSRKAKN
jgi:hypothetical protein